MERTLTDFVLVNGGNLSNYEHEDVLPVNLEKEEESGPEEA